MFLFTAGDNRAANKQKTVSRTYVQLTVSKFCGAGGIEIESSDKVLDDFDAFYFHLKKLLDMIDEMEKIPITRLVEYF